MAVLKLATLCSLAALLVYLMFFLRGREGTWGWEGVGLNSCVLVLPLCSQGYPLQATKRQGCCTVSTPFTSTHGEVSTTLTLGNIQCLQCFTGTSANSSCCMFRVACWYSRCVACTHNVLNHCIKLQCAPPGFDNRH